MIIHKAQAHIILNSSCKHRRTHVALQGAANSTAATLLAGLFLDLPLASCSTCWLHSAEKPPGVISFSLMSC